MSNVTARSSSTLDFNRSRDAEIIACFSALVYSRSKGDYLQATVVHRELERLGVLVRFPRKRKGVDRE